MPEDVKLIKVTRLVLRIVYVVLVLLLFVGAIALYAPKLSVWWMQNGKTGFIDKNDISIAEVWVAPDISEISNDAEGDLIRYGRDLISNTSTYLGPQGTIRAMSNGMNCQNCHLDAGAKPFGISYASVASTYPKFRARSGTTESIEKRVNDCFERSLNGETLAKDSKEMLAIVAYINWLGKDVPQGSTPYGSGVLELTFLNRPADPGNGRIKYMEACAVCHGNNGEGILAEDGKSWINPPLWGEQSYNTGAGIYRISRLAGYIKANMPIGATYLEPLLNDEDAWDIAAFVNTQPHPLKNFNDWPDISKKPLDEPFGPYHDGFSEQQHKYGPYKPIEERRRKLAKETVAKK